jgi:hypothetical protein
MKASNIVKGHIRTEEKLKREYSRIYALSMDRRAFDLMDRTRKNIETLKDILEEVEKEE